MKAVAKLLMFVLLVASVTSSANAQIELPMLGDTSSGMISPRQERALGQEWLRLYRSHVPTSSDHQIINYLEDLMNKMAPHSQLQDPNLSLVLVENDTINAFAVPGGVIGIHTGLIRSAQTEHQLASVIAHEMAHLSQRHYARRLEQQKNMALPFYAALLGSLVLAATTGSEAGMAGIMTTQAAALDAQLRFSRQNEQEADRIGMQTMAQAGMDPRGAAEMFEVMQQAARFNRRPPEFLLTHPITERRIADARNRTLDLGREESFPDNLEFHLMRARVRANHAETPQMAAQRFQSELDGRNRHPSANRYGLALAHTRAGQTEAARAALAPLLEEEPERLTYQLLAADIDTEAGKHDAALARLEGLHKQHPDSHAALMHYAEGLMKAGQFARSTELLENYSRQRRDDPEVWYLLAEVSGLAGNILQVHEARAEFFILNGRYNQAIRHLHHGLRHTDSRYRITLIEERIKQTEEMRRQAERLM
ncbi:M48 family metalloprotease [Marinimicrobium sp. ABcell2]|uniref:M48 family metalloprotease n=1 Tax=Marinimicrobium sp. ABcell2 TaxID=3069751 RepID=UPI0027AEF594|nr:M48 family metalloprotease [Marinimicrobium sp. ABcell2]MDQ2075348.1 M48 family metalloprotease [Marinimicrobium sp. ABcell2]